MENLSTLEGEVLEIKEKITRQGDSMVVIKFKIRRLK